MSKKPKAPSFLQRGMLKWSTDDIPLLYARYRTAQLPPVPHHFGHVGQAEPPTVGGWQMLGNDRFGNCVVAGAAHGQMVWDWATKRTIPQFSDAGIAEQYFELTGGEDTGLDPVQFAQWWQSVGLADASGVRHNIRSLAAITDTDQAIEAAYIFGFSGLGLYLPASAEQQFSEGAIWDDLSGKPSGGHYVPLVGRNSNGNLVVVTWGRLHAMTPAYLNRYFMGGVAYTSRDYMTAMGISPEGYNFAQLDADMAALAG